MSQTVVGLYAFLWVTTAVTAVEAQINTGVEYTVDLGSITYKLVHNLVPWGWEEI